MRLFKNVAFLFLVSVLLLTGRSLAAGCDVEIGGVALSSGGAIEACEETAGGCEAACRSECGESEMGGTWGGCSSAYQSGQFYISTGYCHCLPDNG